jgi:NAD(P)-dependent dehydrogenase (short-subunit alcohol dehydrogenase family)
MDGRAVVTGASRGIGAAIARRLSQEGWKIYNLDLAPPAADSGDDAHWIEVDLADAGPIQGLVNNAAIARAALIEETTAEDFDRAVAVNMRAPMICVRALAAGMREAKFGRIVNISSRAHLGKTHRTAYGGTKGGILSMGRVWALELERGGTTCNTIAPGPIRTELFERVNPPEMPRTKEIIESVPVGRLGEPADVANAVAFFMDERAGYVTGQTLYVCGGITLARGGS